jgi:hypothetical protein
MKPLEDMLKRAGITDALIIDDVYDEPTFVEISQGDLQVFALTFADDTTLRSKVEALGLDPDGGSQKEETLKVLWRHCIKSPADDVAKRAIESIFAVRADRRDVLEKLDGALASCGLKVSTVGATEKIPAAKGLVFLDFILNPGLTNSDREHDLACQIVRILYEKQATPPYVILISDVENVEATHRSAVCHKVGEMGGFFGFIRKRDLEDETVLCLKLAELGLGQENSVGRVAIRDYAKAVAKAAGEAARDFNTFIYELELQDYVHLQQFRLDVEGEGLGDYMQALVEAKLGHLFSNQPDVIEKRRILDSVRCATLLPASLNASQTLLGAFHCAQTEPHAPPRLRPARSKKQAASPTRVPSFGDVYVNSVQTKALLVVSPACDLIVSPFLGRRQPPNPAFPVHLVEGNVLGPDKKPAENEAVICTEPLLFGDSFRVIAWQLNRARTVRYGKLPGHLAATGFEFYARLKSLFALAVQRGFLDLAGKIGLPVAPPAAIAADIQIYVGRKVNQLKPVGERISCGAELRHAAKSKKSEWKTEARLTVGGITQVLALLRVTAKMEETKRPEHFPSPEDVNTIAAQGEYWMSCALDFEKDRPGSGRKKLPAMRIGPPSDSEQEVSAPIVLAVLTRS